MPLNPDAYAEFLDAWNAGARGGKREASGCPSANSGLVAALRRLNVTAAFSGHDHDNDFVGEVGGFRLGYG